MHTLNPELVLIKRMNSGDIHRAVCSMTRSVEHLRGDRMSPSSFPNPFKRKLIIGTHAGIVEKKLDSPDTTSAISGICNKFYPIYKQRLFVEFYGGRGQINAEIKAEKPPYPILIKNIDL